MAGRFVGLSDLEWELFEEFITKEVEKQEREGPMLPAVMYLTL